MKNLRWVAVKAAAVCAVVVAPAIYGNHPHIDRTLTMEELATSGTFGTVVTNGYGGLRWTNFLAFDATAFAAGSGYREGVASGKNVFSPAVNGATISSGHRFDLRSAWVTAHGAEQTQFTITASVGGINVSTNTNVVRRSVPMKINFDLRAVNALRFTMVAGGGIVLDDLEVTTPEGHARETPGWFKPGPVYFTPYPVTSAGIGDLNGDGLPDVVVASTNGTLIHLGTRTGGLTAQPVAPFGGEFLTIGDYNNDHRADVVASSPFGAASYLRYTNLTSSATAWIQVPFNTGPLGVGDFDPAVRLVSAGRSDANDIATGDFNADGRLDYAVANHTSRVVALFLNGGNRTFTQTQGVAHPDAPSGLVAVDFDRDGDLDLATAFENGGSVGIALNDGAAAFSRWTLFRAGVARPLAVATADMDGDGLLDLVVRGATSELSLLRGLSDGGYAAPLLIADGGATAMPRIPTRSVAIGDMNGDGAPDILFVSGTEAATLLNVAPPRLSIGMAGDVVRVSWLTNFARGAVLEAAEALEGGWTEHPFEPVVVGNEGHVYDGGGAAMRFFRLRRPE